MPLGSPTHAAPGRLPPLLHLDGDPGSAGSGPALLAWQMSDRRPPLSPRARHFYADDSLIEEWETKADEIQSHLQSDCDNLQ